MDNQLNQPSQGYQPPGQSSQLGDGETSGRPVGPGQGSAPPPYQGQFSPRSSQPVSPLSGPVRPQSAGFQPVQQSPSPIAQTPLSPPPTVVAPPPTTVVSPPPPKVISTAPGETAGEVQTRIIQNEQSKEVKRVRRTYRLESAVGVLFGTIEASLAVRMAFKLLGAKGGNAFVNLLYQFTGIFANPFSGIFGGNPQFGNFELDLASVIAMIIYALVGFGALQLVKLF
ncbi:hypothetical protein ACFLZP_01460 [Patescibacteria group bacterium]